MAEFRQKAALRGGSSENLKTQGGILEIFDLRGGILAIPPPLVTPGKTQQLFYYFHDADLK